MNIGQLIYSRLTTAGTNTHTVISNRLYPNLLPQNPTYPCAVYSQVTQSDISTGYLEMFQIRYQFDCYGITYSSAQSVADAITDDMRGWASLGQALAIVQTRDVMRIDDYDPEVDVHRVLLDVMFWVVDDP